MTKSIKLIQNVCLLIAATVLFLIVVSIMPKSAFATPFIWSEYGGDWSVTDSVYSVSYVNGSPAEQRLIDLNSEYADFTMEADITFGNSNSGNAGFIIRMNNPIMNGDGADKQNAYYIGIDTAGTQVFLGQTLTTHYSQPVGGSTITNNANNTYHLKVIAVGNSIKIYVDNVLKIDLLDSDTFDTTFSSGMVGLRTFVTDATYSNVIIKALTTTTTTTTRTIDNTTKFVTVHLHASNSASLPTTTFYKVDNGATISTGNSILLNTDGIHLITYWSVDEDGNNELQKNEIIKVDLNSSDNEGLVNIIDVVKLLNQQNQNGIGEFSSNDIKLMLEAIRPSFIGLE